LSKLTPILEDAFFDAFNEGREDEASYQGMTYGVWSAILDDNSCSFCDWANNRTFLITGAHPVPPVHFGCRCIIAYYTSEMLEEDGLEVDELFDEWSEPPDSVMPPGTKGK
jgi:hypothetical protein